MSKDVPTLYAGRLLTGFGGGMVDSTIQVTMTSLPILQDLMSGESILKGVHRRNHDAATAGRVGVDAVPQFLARHAAGVRDGRVPPLLASGGRSVRRGAADILRRPVPAAREPRLAAGPRQARSRR
jgi:hypothetical protein